MDISEPWYSYLLTGQKKVEGRKNSPTWRSLLPGQYILVTSGNRSCLFNILAVRKYPSVRDYLIGEGIENCLPGVSSIEDGIAIYRQWSTEEELEKYEFLAIEMRPLI